MVLSNVKQILKLVQSGKFDTLIESEDRYLYKKLNRIKIGAVEEFNFVKQIIQKDLTPLNSEYIVSDWISLLIYRPGDFFGSHKDGHSYSSDNYDTILSAGYLLNNDYTGGRFLIEGKEITPSVGELFTFDRFVSHEITPVQTGVRYSLHFAVNKLKPNTLI
jgi:hypothetical protein